MKLISFKNFILIYLVFISSFHSQNLNKVNYIIPDFQVNENTGYRYSYQMNPKITADCTGNFIVVWEDGRKKADEIYLQYFSHDLVPIKNNIKVSDNTTTSTYVVLMPDVLILPDNTFIIFWIQDIFTNYKICINHFSKELEQIGNTVKFDIDDMYILKAANDGEGNFIIAWMENIEGQGKRILAQRFSSDVSVIGDKITLKSEEQNKTYSSFSITSDDFGNFILAWTEWQKLFFQRFTNHGEKIGDSVNVIDTNYYNANPNNAEIATDSIGNFVVSWIDYRSYPTSIDVYAQRFNSAAEKIGDNYRINTSNSGIVSSLSMSYSKNKEYLITWNHNENYVKNNVWYQRLDEDGIKIGSNTMINNFHDSLEAILPSITSDCFGNCYAAWVTWIHGENNGKGNDLYCRKFNNNNEAVSEEIKINDDNGIPAADQFSPNLTVEDNGNFIIAWLDDRNFSTDIYAQRFLSDGSLVGKNFKVNDSTSSIHSSPIISVTPDGYYVIVWEQNNNQKDQFVAQFYTSDGEAIDSNIIIAEELSENGTKFSDVISNGFNNYIFVTVAHKNLSRNSIIYFQLFSESGDTLTPKVQIENDPDFIYRNNPSISVFPNGNFIISWFSDNIQNYSQALLAQIFSAEGNKIGDKYKIEPTEENSQMVKNKINANSDGSFTLFWTENKNKMFNLKFQKFSEFGNKLDSIVSIKLYDYFFEPNAVDEKGNFIILERKDYKLPYYAQRYNKNGNKIDSSFNIVKHNNNFAKDFKIKIKNGRIYSTWSEPQSNNYYDIWANVLDWNNPTSINELTEKVRPSNFKLFQNYPNPFNPSTKIKYQIPEQVRNDNSSGFTTVRLNVFDILGREIVTLVNTKQTPGNYEVEWNAREYPSGVYFYKINYGDFTEVKKMVLLK